MSCTAPAAPTTAGNSGEALAMPFNHVIAPPTAHVPADPVPRPSPAVPVARSLASPADFSERRRGWVYEFHTIPTAGIPPVPAGSTTLPAEWYVVCKWRNPARSDECPYGFTMGSRVQFAVHKDGEKRFAVGAPYATPDWRPHTRPKSATPAPHTCPRLLGCLFQGCEN